MTRLNPIATFAFACLFAVPTTTRAAEEFKITPDVIYGHKAGMALTFDVIYPKNRTARPFCLW